MSPFKGHFEGAKTFLTLEIVPRCARDNLGVKEVPQKKIMSRSFLNIGILIVIMYMSFFYFFGPKWLFQCPKGLDIQGSPLPHKYV